MSLETLWLLVTLSKRGIESLRLCNTVYLRARRTSVSGVNPNGRQKMPAFFEGMGMSFENACIFLRPFCVLLVTNKQFFSLGKVHQTRLISLNLLSQVSVLLRSLRSPTQNFDSPFGLPQDDTLTLETLWLFVILSTRGMW